MPFGFRHHARITNGPINSSIRMIALHNNADTEALELRSAKHGQGSSADEPYSTFSPGSNSTLRDELRFAIQWLSLLVLPIIMCAAAAYLISQFFPLVYAARADLVMHMQQSGDAAERYLANQVVIIKSPAVLTPISKETGITNEQLDKELSVEFPENGSVMRIQFASQNPEIALDLTRKILNQFELVIAQTEIDENTSHQVISSPALLEKPVRPQHLQVTAIGGAIGLIISLIALALIRNLRSRP